MGASNQLGVFWGKSNLFFVGTASGKPAMTFSVPLPRDAGGGSMEAGPFSPMGIEIISLIQNTFRQKKMAAGNVNVSLPAADIIFRSFVIPWMQSSEVKAVVDFEATKYVPFALDELSYTFFPMTVTEGNLRRIRIIFVAIKKTALENYQRILEQAALRVNIAEPATLSVIRTMVSKELLPKEETVALIEMGDETGNIIVVDHHMPQFVREFPLRIPGPARESSDPQALITRMMNEVRISLNYFNRHEERLKVTKALLLSSHDHAEIIRRLEGDLQLAVVSITTGSVLPDASLQDVSFLKAYGAALHQSTSLPADLNLSEVKAKTPRTAAVPVKITVHYKTIIVTALLCLPVIFLSFFVTHFMAQKQEARIAALDLELKSSKEMSVQNLQQGNEALTEKLNYLKNIQMGSGIAAFLVMIPQLLPDGVWVDQIDIVYPDIIASEGDKMKGGSAVSPKEKDNTGQPSSGKPALDIKGYAYSINPGDQFTLVNKLLANLKENKEFSSFFDNMDFETIQAKPFGKYPATFFYLKCR